MSTTHLLLCEKLLLEIKGITAGISGILTKDMDVTKLVDKMWTKLAIVCFCCILATFITPADSYQTYYMAEDYCKDGSFDNPGRITLGETGKSTAIILEYARAGITSRRIRSCVVNVYAPDDSYAVVVSIREIRLTKWAIFGTCDDKDRLRITTNPKSQMTYCKVKRRIREDESLISEGQNFASFELSSTGGSQGFEVIVTAVKKPDGKNCSSSFFECANKYCVAEELLCDFHNNCGDHTDERNDCPLPLGALITILVTAGLIVLIIIVSIGYYIVKKRRSKSSGTVVTTTTETQPPPLTGAEYQPMHPQPPPSSMYVPPAPGPDFAPYLPMQPLPYGLSPADGSGIENGSTKVVPPAIAGAYPPFGGPNLPPSAPAGNPYPPPGTAPQPY